MARLRECGHETQAEELRKIVHGTAWSSSSEMLGEIGLCILRIQRDAGAKLPKEIQIGLERCLGAVRETWPAIKLSRAR
ncbi:MAG: hypothetical protein ACE145_17670 [Terriglobia bacterium]